MFKAFDYSQPPHPPQKPSRDAPQPFEFTDPEQLSGVVHGKPASSLEERYAKALDKLIRANIIEGYNFSMRVPTSFQIPGQENEVDFFVWQGDILFPMEVDGEFTHKSGEQKAHDAIRDAILNDEIRRRYPGAQPIERIPGTKLETQAKADETAREQF